MSLSLDFTGALGANSITEEAQTVTPAPDSAIYIYTANGPFFAKNLVVQFTDANSGATTTLVAGLDYLPVINFPMIGVSTGLQIYGAVQLLNFNLTGTIKLNYQALGGSWTMDPVQIQNYVSANMFNPNNAFMALVPNTQLTRVDGITPLTLDSQANITLAQTKYGSIRLGIAYLPSINNGSKSVGVQRVAGVISATNTTGTTLAGAIYVAIKNVGTGSITVAGGAVPAGDEVVFTARPGETIYPITYTVPSSGTARISTLA